MAFLQVAFFSKALSMNTAVNVILPEITSEEYQAADGRPPRFQTLYLLHGYSGDCTDWVRFSSVERYAQQYRLAVIMPSAGNSFYCNCANGGQYWNYIAEELPQMASTFFPLSSKREDNFVAGLSMGGYGALKLALRLPNRFCAAVSFSGVVDLYEFARRCNENPRLIPNCEPPNFNAIFGGTPAAWEENDLTRLLHRPPADLPKLRMYCGEDDFQVQDNRRFHRFLKEQDVECELVTGPGGHEWNFWDCSLKDALAWLPLKQTILY